MIIIHSCFLKQLFILLVFLGVISLPAQSTLKKFTFKEKKFVIYYDTDGSVLQKEYQRIIDSIIKYYPYRKKPYFLEGIFIYGFTDSIGSIDKNMYLSWQRVINLEKKLKSIGIDNIKYIDHFGESKTNNEESLNLNRRVEIIIPIDKKFYNIVE